MTPEQYAELSIMNMIKDGDHMIYTSPLGEFIFDINRFDNSFYSVPGMRYMIDIDIKNNLGTMITKLRMSECDALRVLDSLDVFINDYNHSAYENMVIYLNTPQTIKNYYTLQVDRMDVNLEDINILPEELDADNYKRYPMLDYANSDVRDIKLTISEYNPVSKYNTQLLNFILSDQELIDFMYAIFFVSLIDIDLSPEDENIINRVLDRSLMYYRLNPR